MTVSLAPLPYFRSWDNNGNPLVGGLLYTYVAGTSTPQATYTDSTQSTPNTNPVVLNFRGEASVWLNTALTYKLVLTDSVGHQIWSQDQIAGGYLPTAQSVGMLLYPQTAAEIAAGVTPVNYFWPPLTVDRYGTNTVPGTTDMGPAISAAIAVASQPTGAFSLGGAIQYLDAVYYVGTPVAYTANYIAHVGANEFGSIIVNGSANQPVFKVGDGSTQLNGGGFANLRFTQAAGVTAVAGNCAIYVAKAQYFYIENVTISSTFGSPYRGVYLTNCSQHVIYNLQNSSCLLDGISLISCTDSYVTDSRSDFNGGCGWNLEASQGGYYKACTAYFNTAYAWYLVSGLPATFPNSNNFFINCIGDTSGSHNWLIGDSIDSYWIGSWGSTQQSRTVNTFASGFFIQSVYSKNLFFTGCVAVFNNAHGFDVYDSGAAAPTDIHFVNCQGGSPGITTNLGNGQAAGGGYGLILNGVTSQIRVIGGSYLGNATGSIANTSTGTDVVISGAVGYVTNNEGQATIGTGNTSVTVNHGLGFTPAPAQIQIWPTGLMSASGINSMYVSAASSTTFTVTTNASVSGSNFTFGWRGFAHGT
jgi:hypothetical protein